MTCDEFYGRWRKLGNFCEKHPVTAGRINEYLEKLLPLLEKLASENEILNTDNTPIGALVTERASRPGPSAWPVVRSAPAFVNLWLVISNVQGRLLLAGWTIREDAQSLQRKKLIGSIEYLWLLVWIPHPAGATFKLSHFS